MYVESDKGICLCIYIYIYICIHMYNRHKGYKDLVYTLANVCVSDVPAVHRCMYTFIYILTFTGSGFCLLGCRWLRISGVRKSHG